MRQVQVHTSSEGIGAVLRLAREHGSRHPVAVSAARAGERPERSQGEAALALVHLPNDRVGRFVDRVRAEVDGARFVLLPLGTLPLGEPPGRVSEQVADVSRLSTLELVLGSLQSVGSFRGLALFSVFAGIIGAYGLIFDAGYLLVGAMLINPMGAPALVAVIAAAVGEPAMFGRGAARFALSLVLQSAAAMAIGFAYGLEVATGTMAQVASLSAWIALVGLAAGAAGAQTLVKSDRDSLVSGAAAGFMVAAALAPPAAVLGLSVPLGRWDHAELMAFLLVLQFAAIGLGGFITLACFGVRPSDRAVGRGQRRWRNLLALGLLLATAALVGWQLHGSPRYLKGDLSRRGLEIARAAVDEVPGAAFVEASSRFVRPDLRRYSREALLVEVAVEAEDPSLPSASLSSDVREAVRDGLERRMTGVAPLVDVTVLPGPDGSRARP